MATVRIGIVGAGLIAREHAKSLVRRQRVKLAVFDPAIDRAKAFAADFGADLRASEHELVAGSDIVWVCSPPAFHRPTVAAACRAGKAVFCEKPLAHTRRDARAIAKLVQDAGIPFYMGQSGRWNKVFEQLGNRVKAGEIGEPVAVWSTRTGFLDPKTTPAWRMSDEASGGVIVELGVHEIDFIRWVGGEWGTVSAVGSAKTLAPGRYQDSINAHGTLTNGAFAYLELSWAEPRYQWYRGARGTEGSLYFDDSNFGQLMLERHGRPPKRLKSVDWLDPKTGDNLAFVEQAKAVLKAHRASVPFSVTLEDGLAAVEIAAAIRKSIDTGKTQRVPNTSGGA